MAISTVVPEWVAHQMDDRYAALLRVECATGDWEHNAHRRDGLIVELLRDLGMRETLAAWRAVEVR